jgi:hypothetical protein
MAQRRSASYPKRVVLRHRPTRTVVRTQYVQGASAPVSVGGGTVSPATPAAPAPAPAPAPANQPANPAPPPPPPPPPPAPPKPPKSSGS